MLKDFLEKGEGIPFKGVYYFCSLFRSFLIYDTFLFHCMTFSIDRGGFNNLLKAKWRFVCGLILI